MHTSTRVNQPLGPRPSARSQTPPDITSLAEQQYISDILGLINHGDPQIRGATAILCGAIIQAALTKTRYSIHPWLASVQSATGLWQVNFARACLPVCESFSLTNLSVLLPCRQHCVPGGLGTFAAKDFKR